MLERLFVVLTQVSTLFLLMGVGYVLTKAGKLTETGTKELSNLLVQVVTPCIIIQAFPAQRSAETLKSLLLVLAVTLGCYLLYAAVAQLFFRRENEDCRGILRYAMMYGNAGYMGFPLVRAILGDQAVLYAAVTIVAFNIMTFTHGAVVMGGRKAISLKKAFINPGVLATLIGLAVFLSGLRLPGPVDSVMSFFSQTNTPLGMTIIGAQLARSDLKAVFRNRKLYTVSAYKLLLIPAITMAALLPFKLEPTLYITMVILSATPAAGFTSIFAQRYGRDAAMAAQIVSMSTMLSILTLPAVAVLAELLAG